ncbi:hypothetical protein EST38_g11558 [Candolleomyces aberdarensis]|uniref:Uncharacterized protein n=1 Tax=Candolleomyces aberdarensis TaxID=2316362 RepID=A0A4Q2D797_9AGAR|nr:hypothetical protein EST38_g11558 [Candolleomyces aberdarensis]
MPRATKTQNSHRRAADDSESGEEIEIPSDLGSDSASKSDSGLSSGGAATKPAKSSQNDTTKAMQLALDQALKENRELKLEKAELKRKAKEAKQKSEVAASGSKHKSDQGSKLSSNDDRIALLGKKFFFLNEPFVPPNAFIFDKITSVDVTDPSRYETDSLQLAVLRREIWETTPEDLRGLLKGTTHFRDIFRTKGSDNLRHIISELRKGAIPTIFANSVTAYATGTDRSAIPECVSRFKKSGSTRFSKYAPVIFPDGKEDMDRIFRVLHLPLIAKAALFGKSAIKFDEDGKAKKPKGPPTVGIIWGVNEATPGMVAISAVLRRLPIREDGFESSSDDERAFCTNREDEQWMGDERSNWSDDLLDDALSSVGSDRQVGDRRNLDTPDDTNPPHVVAKICPPSTSAEPPITTAGSEACDDGNTCRSINPKEVAPKKSSVPKEKGKKPASRRQRPDAKTSKLVRELAQLAITKGPAEGKNEGPTARRSTRKPGVPK